MRLVFLGSPPFATPVLAHLVASPHQVIALVTPPDRPRGRGHAVRPSELVLLARENGIPVVQPQTTKDEAFVRELAGFEPDVLMVASYGEILRSEVLDLAPHGSLNVHGSLLPRWRGAAPIQRAIEAGDSETGVSIQRMVLALDEGDVLCEERTEIRAGETAGELFDRLADLGAVAAIHALDLLESGTATFTPQDESLATYARKLKKEHGRIDWTRPAIELERLIRAVTPWPGGRTGLPDGRDMVLARVRVADDLPDSVAANAKPGEVLDFPQRLVVMTGEGALDLERVKPAGKAEMEAEAFLRGARVAPGSLLGGD